MICRMLILAWNKIKKLFHARGFQLLSNAFKKVSIHCAAEPVGTRAFSCAAICSAEVSPTAESRWYEHCWYEFQDDMNSWNPPARVDCVQCAEFQCSEQSPMPLWMIQTCKLRPHSGALCAAHTLSMPRLLVVQYAPRAVSGNVGPLLADSAIAVVALYAQGSVSDNAWSTHS